MGASPFWALLSTARQGNIVRSAFRVTLVVGTILNLINQGGPLLDGLPPSWFHLVLNYLVPFGVSSYSMANNRLRQNNGETP